MRMDKLTSKFQLALADAQSMAVGRDHQFIEPVHVMSALLEQEGGAVRGVLTKAGVDLNRLRSSLGQALDRLPTVQGGALGEVHVSNDLGRHLNVMDKLAQERGDAYISSERFVLAARKVVSRLGRVREEARGVKGGIERAIEDVRGAEKVVGASAEEARQALDKYPIDLTAPGEQGKLVPVIGRDDEIR